MVQEPGLVHDLSYSEIMTNPECSSHHSDRNNFPSDSWLANTCSSHQISYQREKYFHVGDQSLMLGELCGTDTDTTILRINLSSPQYRTTKSVQPTTGPLGTKIFRLRRENI